MSLRAFVALGALALVVVVAGIAVALGLPPGGTFVDDDGNIHEGNIEAIAADGVTAGCNPPSNDRFCPSSTVTRGQMAAFLVRAADLPVTSTNYFDDDGTSIFEDNINALAAAGVTLGCNPPANDRFCPDGEVTRGQMAAFLVRAFRYTDDGGGNLFIDDDGSVFESDIDKLKTAGVTAGCNPPANDRYCPNDHVHRDQMASFLARALKLDPIVPPPRQSNCPVSGACSPDWPADSAGARSREAWRSVVAKYWQADRVECVLDLIRVESTGNPQARNPKGGYLGLLQHSPWAWNQRAAAAGFKDGNGLTAHPYNGEANIAAGAWLANNSSPWWKPWPPTGNIDSCKALGA
ncbi:MAG: hypothetical protein BMS9Abin07_2110 [Acidimicrobiia bacterium]|nr:MAG: hypothetical protein BMS9Abin07_2110 [Acidimicrobiia bacterium]